MESRFGDDYLFPSPSAGFLNRVNKQLGNVVDTLYQLEAGSMSNTRLVIANGEGPSPLRHSSSILTLDNISHPLQIDNGKTQQVLALMDQAFKTNRSPGYMENLSASTQHGYNRLNMYPMEASGPKNLIGCSQTPLQITDGTIKGSAPI